VSRRRARYPVVFIDAVIRGGLESICTASDTLRNLRHGRRGLVEAESIVIRQHMLSGWENTVRTEKRVEFESTV